MSLGCFVSFNCFKLSCIVAFSNTRTTMQRTIIFNSFHEIEESWNSINFQSYSLIILQIFYIIMFLTTVGTSKLHGRRDAWHSGWWSAKIILWIALTIITFLVPSAFFQIYGLCHFTLHIESQIASRFPLSILIQYFNVLIIYNRTLICSSSFLS